MASQSTKEREQRFDINKLQAMQEPLTVRVEKLRGNARQPIELPAKGTPETGFSPPGVGWTRDEVLGLENFILTKWSGGGYYEFTVTDGKADRMVWTGVWDPRLYPEKVPPNTVEAAVVGAATTAVPVAGPPPVPPAVQPFGVANQPGGWPSSVNMSYSAAPFNGPYQATAPAPAVAAPVAAAGAAVPVGTAPGAAPGVPGGNPRWQGGDGSGWNNWNGPTWNGSRPRRSLGDHMDYGFGSDRDRDGRDRDRDRGRDDAEKRALEERLRAIELEKKESEYKAALERQRLANETQIKSLQDEIRRLAESRNKGEDEEVRRAREEAQRQREEAQRQREQFLEAQAAAQRQLLEQQANAQRQMMEAQLAAMREQLTRVMETPKSEPDEFRRLREEQDRQRQEFERQRQEHERRLELERAERERERERYERERRDEALQRELRETREATERRFEQFMLAQQQNKGPDPVIEALKEQARQSGEQMREIARMQQQSSDRMAQFMVAPAQLAQLMKDTSSGSDVVMRNLVDTVSGIGNMYKTAAEQMLNMSGGGGEPPAVRLIQEGLGRASEVADRFLAMKRDAAVSEAKVKQAQAQAEQTKIAAEAQLRAAAINAQVAQARWAAPTAIGGGGGLNGADVAPVVGNAAPPPVAADKPSNGVHDHVSNGSNGVNGHATKPPAPSAETSKQQGPSEEEMFGVALESIRRLRRGVADGKLTPSETIDAVLKGVDHVVSNNLQIPAFTLFTSERWADFVDVLLPAAPQDFRTECVRILIEEVETDDDGDGDEDDTSDAVTP